MECSISGCFSHVMMVESTDFLEFDDSPLANKLGWSSIRRVIAENDEHEKDFEISCWNRKEIE